MSLKRRIARLEQSVPAAPEVMGYRIDDGPVRVNGEEMSLAAYEAAYPDGRLIQIHIVNERPDESRSAPYRAPV